jgi:murein DD-endopeptidase MepM/ murein hydrolase activator NlpD
MYLICLLYVTIKCKKILGNLYHLKYVYLYKTCANWTFIFKMAATSNRYNIPVPLECLQKIDSTSSPAHILSLRNAIDFIAPQNMPVLAAADGIVTFVKDDSNTGGPYPFYWDSTNFIIIEHSNGEYSRYDHLEYHSAKVSAGQLVKAGQ